MATKAKLKTTIKDLQAAINSSATPAVFIPKMKQELAAAEKELKELEEAEKNQKPQKKEQVQKKINKTVKQAQQTVKKAKAQPKAKPKAQPKRPKSPGRVSFKEAVKRRRAQSLSTHPSDVERDASRPALPKGKRISKQTGKAYWEYRENRIDRKQPPKRYPKLAKGGMVQHGIEIGDMVVKDLGDKGVLVKNGGTMYIVHIQDGTRKSVDPKDGMFAEGGILAPMTGGVDADPRFDILSAQFGDGGETGSGEPHRMETMKKGGNISSYNYLSNRDIESVTTWDGVVIDGNKILDGFYVKKSVKL